MNSKAGPIGSLPFAVIMVIVALVTAGCSAVELYQSQASATARTAGAAAAATADPALAALASDLAAARATEQALSAGATALAATIAALEATPAATDNVFPLPASAEVIVYGRVPIDSDRLNIIAALAFDAEGQLLVATRAGEIYALPDSDGDGVADETRLIFADERQQLGQVSGLIARGEALILLNGERLSLLTDGDGDGVYDAVAPLSEGLPADQSPLQASNGIALAPDGRLFTVDINAGEILRIVLGE